MSAERIIINLPPAQVAPYEVYDYVSCASQQEEHASPQTRQLQQHLTKILAPHDLPVELVGNNCIGISDYDENIPQILQFISPLLSRYPTLTVLEFSEFVWTFGDENTNFSTETSEYSAPWASLRGLPSWIELITTNACTMTELNLGNDPRDFLIITNATKHQHYMQCYYSPVDRTYRVEIRLGDAQHHYWHTTPETSTVIHELTTWITTGTHSTHGWQKLNIT